MILDKHFLSVVHAIGAMDGRKPQVAGTKQWPCVGLRCTGYRYALKALSSTSAKVSRALAKILSVLEATRGSPVRKEGATDKKNVR